VIRRLLAALVLAAAPLLPGCGGVPVDATELHQFREQLIADLRSLELPAVRVDASELERLRDQLKADIARVEDELRRLRDEARDEPERAAAPETPASGVQ